MRISQKRKIRRGRFEEEDGEILKKIENGRVVYTWKVGDISA